MNVIEIIEKLADTSSRNEKEELLNKYDSPLIRKVMKTAYNPLLNFYIRQIPKYDDSNGVISLDEAIDEAVKYIAGRKVTGGAASDYLTNLLEDLTIEDALVLERIIERDMKCGVSASTLNKVFGPGFVTNFKVMKAQPFREDTMAHIKYPAYSQKKADAMRINVFYADGAVTFITANGKPLDLAGSKLEKSILDICTDSIDLMIDGELMAFETDDREMSRQESNGIANKAVKGTISDAEKDLFKLAAWDIVYMSEYNAGKSLLNYEDRLGVLADKLKGSDGSVFVIETTMVHDAEEAKADAHRYIAAGFEGTILKNLDSKWEPKRSKYQVKFKAVYDGEFVIVDVEEGKNKNAGKLGAFVIESKCGKMRCNVGTGFSDHMRELYWTRDMIGKIVTVQYNGIVKAEGSDTHKLYLPVFVEVRIDKDEANSLDELEGVQTV